eukprot:gb/GECH01004411.1/.p1 GENE.gb/GECH01004411.1/~~gb/GECH01004411.1/.p1  ORF type:complete len:207 (+),score=70.31 gb/GECH01004411.1/:1-621(+)
MKNKSNQNKTFNVIVIGSAGVGKSSLVKYFCEGKKSRKEITVSDETFILEIDEFGGDQVDVASSQKADGHMLVFDITNQQSFDDLMEIHDTLKTKVKTQKGKWPFVLIGNKFDQTKNRQVPIKDALKLSDDINCNYLEASTLSGRCVNDAFMELTKQIIQYHHVKKLSSPRGGMSFLKSVSEEEGDEGLAQFRKLKSRASQRSPNH